MDHKEEHHEPVGYGTYILVWLGLVVLTGMTVAIAGVDLRSLAVTAALSIIFIKSGLVLWFFMHLKYDRLIFKVMFLVVLATIAVILGLTFVDVGHRY